MTAALALALLLPSAGTCAMQSAGVTVYRCIDAKGHVTLGDAPCPTGSKEEVRTMQRPQDAPPQETPAPSPQASLPVEAPAPPPQVIVMRTPQPMYECVTPDGKRYTSDNGDGNLRWVPLWTQGYGGRHRTDATQGGDIRPANSIWHNIGRPWPAPSTVQSPSQRPPGRPPQGGYFQGGGYWVRDTCHALPQAEICSRLFDRREEIRRRFFNAQETERNELRREERGINARMAADCG